MTDNDSTELETFGTRRSHRGATEAMTVIRTDDPQTFAVSSSSGSTYAVSTTGHMTCSCPDVEHNLGPEERCKHQWRVAFATGEDALPAEAEAEVDAVLQRRVEDEEWGAHYAPADAVEVATGTEVAADGGQCEACAELPGEFPCADCYVSGDAEVPEDPADA